MIGSPFIPGYNELRPFAAELWLTITIVTLLLTPFFTPGAEPKATPRLSPRANLISAAVALLGLSLALLSTASISADSITGEHLRGMLVADGLAVCWKCILLLFVIGVIVMHLATTFPTLRNGEAAEFYCLLLGATLGMSLMGSTSNLLMIFLAVETASLPSYVLAGHRKTNRLAAEASLKYVVFGAAASAIMVYGLSLMYGQFGTLQLSQIAHALSQGHSGGALLAISLAGLLVGLGFKIAAVPMHLWCPDVFEGAGIEVTTFLSVASKGAGLVLLLRIVMTIAAATGYQNSPHLSLSALAAVIGILGGITATLGNVAAFTQNNIKRLLAYSSIAQAGYILCALSLLLHESHTPSLAPSPLFPAQIVLIYLAVYLFMNLGAFTVAGIVFRQSNNEDLSAYNNLRRRSPLLAAAMFCCLVSLIGLPPFAGFTAKLYLLTALMQSGGAWWALVAVIALNSVLSAFYYFRVIKAMYLQPDQGESSFIGHPLGAALAIACAGMLVLLFIGANSLSNLTSRFSQMSGIEAADAKIVSAK